MSIIVKMLNDTYDKLIKDEYLLRLLYEKPSSPQIDFPLLPEDNLIHEQDLDQPPTPEYEKMWKIIYRHILKTSKSDDLEENRLCRIYVYLGQTRPTTNNRLVAKQEIITDIFVHDSYEIDQRMERLLSRINDLLIHEQVTGLGKVDLRSGYNFTAPKEYIAYRVIYEVGRTK